MFSNNPSSSIIDFFSFLSTIIQVYNNSYMSAHSSANILLRFVKSDRTFVHYYYRFSKIVNSSCLPPVTPRVRLCLFTRPDSYYYLFNQIFTRLLSNSSFSKSYSPDLSRITIYSCQVIYPIQIACRLLWSSQV